MEKSHAYNILILAQNAFWDADNKVIRIKPMGKDSIS